jgi:hypothetical protein
MNITGSFGPLPGFRIGGKTLLLGAPLRLAADYGASYYLYNGVVDVGLLASVTAEGVVYAGLRGFGNLPLDGRSSPTLAGALTVGGAISLGTLPEAGRLLLELSLLAHGYNGVVPSSEVQPVGFSFVPALGFTF